MRPIALFAEAERIPEPTRSILLMSLLGIALLGLFLIVLILLGGNWVRRLGAHRRGPTVPPDRAPLRRREGGESRQPADRTANDAGEAEDLVAENQSDTLADRDDALGETRVD